MFSCLSAVLRTDKLPEVRRAAVLVVTLLLTGLGKDALQVCTRALLPVSSTDTCTHARTHPHTLARTHAYVHTHTHTHTHARTHARTHACIHPHERAHTSTRTHAYTIFGMVVCGDVPLLTSHLYSHAQ